MCNHGLGPGGPGASWTAAVERRVKTFVASEPIAVYSFSPINAIHLLMQPLKIVVHKS